MKMKNVIHIYGASGSGTTTLARKISEELGYKFMDTDDYYWMPTNPKYTTKRSVEERLSLMKKDIEEADNAVISGSMTGWGDELILLFTMTVRLVIDSELRMERLRIREREKFGDRILPDADMYEIHKKFIEWASEYDTGDVNMRSKAKHDLWQKKLQCKQIVLNGADDLTQNYDKVKMELYPVLGKEMNVLIDRPLGSYHPEHKDMFYTVNYGYVEGIMAEDGEEQDVYVLGVDKPLKEFYGKVIAVVHRNDDCEEKWVVAPEGMKFQKDEIWEQIYFQEQYFDSIIIL